LAPVRTQKLNPQINVQIRDGQEVFGQQADKIASHSQAAARHIALNLLRQEHSRQRSLRQQRLLCDLDEHDVLMMFSRAAYDALTLALVLDAHPAHPHLGRLSMSI
jgi:hypothetical protein